MSWKHKGLALLLVSLCAGSQTAASAPDKGALARSTADRIDAIFADAIGAKKLPGASVAIAFDDGRIFSRQYGLQDLNSNQPVVRTTRFRIGSISKFVTALAIMKLVEERRLALDTDIASLFRDDPILSKLPKTVTVKRLLNHTSGLPDFTRTELEEKVARGISTDADLIAVLNRPLVYEPGTQWAYADAPFRILSRLIERTTRSTYDHYISKRLAPALGLQSLQMCRKGLRGLASGYLSKAGQLISEPAYSIGGLLGEGGLCATAEDLARLPGALARGTWIGAGSLSAMTTPTRLAGGARADYGLGVRLGLFGDLKTWGHTGGGLDGSWASLVHYPERGITVAVVANGTGSEADASTLQAVVAAEILKTPPLRDLTIDAALTKSIMGSYRRGNQTTCIYEKDGRLLRSRKGSSVSPHSLLHQGDGIFGRQDFPVDRIAFQREADTAISYRVYYDGLFTELWERTGEAQCARAAVESSR